MTLCYNIRRLGATVDRPPTLNKLTGMSFLYRAGKGLLDGKMSAVLSRATGFSAYNSHKIAILIVTGFKPELGRDVISWLFRTLNTPAAELSSEKG